MERYGYETEHLVFFPMMIFLYEAFFKGGVCLLIMYQGPGFDEDDSVGYQGNASESMYHGADTQQAYNNDDVSSYIRHDEQDEKEKEKEEPSEFDERIDEESNQLYQKDEPEEEMQHDSSDNWSSDSFFVNKELENRKEQPKKKSVKSIEEMIDEAVDNVTS